MSWTRSGGGRKRRPRPSGTVHRILAVLRVPCTTSIPPRTLRSIICRSRRSAAFRVRCARQSFVRPSGSAAQAPREAGILGLETQRGKSLEHSLFCRAEQRKKEPLSLEQRLKEIKDKNQVPCSLHLPHPCWDWARPCLHLHRDRPDPLPHLQRKWTHFCRICTGAGAHPLPHLRRDWGSPLPHLHWDWGSPLPHLHRGWGSPLPPLH